jgi:hypothetical protein
VIFCDIFDSVSMVHSDFSLSGWPKFGSPPPTPPLGMTEKHAILRSPCAITRDTNMLHAQPRACF